MRRPLHTIQTQWRRLDCFQIMPRVALSLYCVIEWVCIQMFLSLCEPATNEGPALQDVPALCEALRPSLPLDRQLCRREKPQVVPAVPVCSVCCCVLGSTGCMVSECVWLNQHLVRLDIVFKCKDVLTQNYHDILSFL